MKNDRKFPPNGRLRDARLERGWSQRDLAGQVGTTFVNISRWENGTNFPSPYFRQKLCRIFDKTPAELGLLPPPESTRWNIPYPRNPFFTGREHLLEMLHERFLTARKTAVAQALYGLGGIGKTQTVVEYAFRYGDDYTHVFWIRAAKRETMSADFVSLADLLDLPEKGEQDQSQVIAAIRHWLASHDTWLLILDNADDLHLAREFLPTRHRGHILFTTRAQAVGMTATSIEVEKLRQQESALLLLRWTRLLDVDAPLTQARATDRVVAERIAIEMDGLPLAIVQAAAYVEETGCSLADYLNLFKTHRKDLLARHSRLLVDYPETVATMWSLAFERIEQAAPAATDLLRLCSFLAPDAIPEELLTRGAAELGTALATEASDPFKLNEVIEVLRRYSLVQRNRSTHMLSIHRLVQAVLRESMDQETQRIWAERTVRAVNAAFPEADDGSGEKQYYLQFYVPHVQQCARLIEQYGLPIPEAGQLLYKAGVFLYFYGFYPQAQSLHQQALAVREQVYGPEHPEVSESLNALALFARFQGDYEQAEKLHQRALDIREKALGPHHPATAQSLNNLGVLYRVQGKYEQAEPLLHRALSISEQSSGAEHPDTLYSLLNLAKLYIEQRKYEQAEPLARQVLAISERVLEPGHPIVTQSLNLRAQLFYEQGNYEQAEALWRQALTIIEKTFGLEHPSTAERLNNLAELYVAQGRFTQAEVLCRRALDICERILGPEHPDTITYRQHLSRIGRKKEVEQRDGHCPPAPPGR